ncbi:MAG: DUF3054 domain-containing protein [Micrococcales bacterium]|nr:DUF3054 domain-containing protein [Micrococcales bacterium]
MTAATTPPTDAAKGTHVPKAAALAGLADAALVSVFATIGRASHEHGLSVVGVAQTALPFLTGTALGWVVCLAMRRRAPLSVGDGLVVWIGTLVGGMILRAATGQGTAVSFIVVAGVVTGAFLLGWRALAGRLRRR